MNLSQRFNLPKGKIMHRLRSVPILILMPHSACNCRCVMCDIWRANANKHELSVEFLERHLPSIEQLGVRWVVLSGGEALLHRNLWTFCELIKTLNIKITLLSTGLLLKKYAVEVVQWCDEVIVSLDGSPAVHNEIRRIPYAFERLAEGIHAIREVDKNFRITGRCVLQKANYFDFEHIIQTAQDIGLHQISFLAVDVSETGFAHENAPRNEDPKNLALGEKEIGEFEHLLENAIQRFDYFFNTGFIAETPQKLRRMVAYFKAIAGEIPFSSPRCNAPWVSAVIESDGKVRPCFFHDAIGNIHDSSLEQILNSTKAISFRQHLDVAKNPTCQRCTCSLYLRSSQLDTMRESKKAMTEKSDDSLKGTFEGGFRGM